MDDLLLYPKLAYLSLSLSFYATYVYTPNYLEEHWGIPTHSYGYITAICVLSLFGSLLWGRMAERFDAHRAILVGCTTAYAVLFGALWFGIGAKESLIWRVIIVCVLYGGAGVFGSAMTPLLDRVVLLSLPDPDTFGRQRLWGSLGHALVVTLNGWGIERFGYGFMFIALAASTASFIAIMLCYPVKSAEQPRPSVESIQLEKSVAVGGNSSMWGPVSRLLTSSPFVMFIIGTLMAGYVRCVVGTFVPVYFKKVRMMKDLHYGLAMQARLIPEILFFFYGKTVVAHTSNETVMLIGHLTGVLRSAIYGLAPTTSSYSWITVPGEVLKGINHASITMAGTKIANTLATPGCETTALAAFHGIYGSLAMIVAGIAGGVVLDYFGDNSRAFQVLFQWTAIAGLLPVLFFIIRRHH
ncbi:Major facilitator superfamily domain-containing protein [Paramicrosporidium saccamoebae]|uniref:Major facilitator superfamily domain-containing protein n=1 Tax=Paramicrosporidium saccamoebae TaxID=1246581 RepID=A0A2H9TMV6_9FUNG|nr:Major facilitator superfamily domain-containing protein [Paramicrosporidium saccamoebae]